MRHVGAIWNQGYRPPKPSKAFKGGVMTGAITWGPRAVNSVGVDDGSILRSVEERSIEARERWMKWMRRWMRSELVIIVQAA